MAKSENIYINTPTYSPISTEPGKDGSSEKPNNHEGGVILGDNGYVVDRSPNIHLVFKQK